MNLVQRKEVVTGVQKAAEMFGTLLLVFDIIGIITGIGLYFYQTQIVNKV